MKPDRLTDAGVGTLTERRPFVGSAAGLVLARFGVWLWGGTEEGRSGNVLVCDSTRTLNGADVNLWRYIPAQRRRRAWARSSSGRRCHSGLPLRRHRKQIQVFVGLSTLGILCVSFHRHTVIGTLRLRWPGLLLLRDAQVWGCVDGFPAGSPLLWLLHRDVRPAFVVVHWRFLRPIGGSWGNGQEVKTTYTIAPANSWSLSHQLWSRCRSFLWFLILKSWEERLKTQL